MDLLVSVRDADEARAAVVAGATVIDLKDPAGGSLGAPAPADLRAVAAVVGDRPFSVALGDVGATPGTVGLAAHAAAAEGADVVKVGLRGPFAGDDEIVAVVRAVRDAVGPAVSVVAGGYADVAGAAGGPVGVEGLVGLAVRGGADGCLLDTLAKDGPTLLEAHPRARLAALVREGHAAGLHVALAGRLGLADLPVLADLGADLAGVRSAVCRGGRTGPLDADLVRAAVRAAAGAEAGG